MPVSQICIELVFTVAAVQLSQADVLAMEHVHIGSCVHATPSALVGPMFARAVKPKQSAAAAVMSW